MKLNNVAVNNVAVNNVVVYNVAVYNVAVNNVVVYNVAVYNLRMCMKDDNPGPNISRGMGCISSVVWGILVVWYGVY